MILQGNTRGGARNLALHLLKEENEHVTVHEMRGFIADELEPAFNEVYATSRGTKAEKYLFSLSLNPPLEANVSTEDFEKAIETTEKELGFEDQPRAIVFHEKQARRHCHVVWSRIDAKEMKAIPMPYYKNRLMDISRDLYVEHGWKMPKGMVKSQERDPTNFTLADWQQAKRAGKDPKDIKTVFQDCWAISDSLPAFQQALKERGYSLAKGDRRGFVAIDQKCEVYSVARQLPKGINTRQVKEKLGSSDHLPSVEQAKASVAQQMAERLQLLSQKQQSAFQDRLKQIDQKRIALVESQKQERLKLTQSHDQRFQKETEDRQARYNTGLRGLLDRFTGKHRFIKQKNEQETEVSKKRDKSETDNLIFTQMKDRRSLESRHQRLKDFAENKEQTSNRDIEQFRQVQKQKLEKPDFAKDRLRDRPQRELSQD